MNRKKSGKAIIAALVLVFAVVLGGLAGVLMGIIFKNDESSGEAPEVVDAVNCIIADDHCYHIPKLEGKSEKIEAINKKINDDLYPLYEQAEKGMKANSIPNPSLINYKVGAKDNILSIIVFTSQYGCFIPDVYIYNIDIKEEKFITDSEVYSAFGYDENTFFEKVKESVKAVSDNILKDLTGPFSADEFTGTIEKTLSPDVIRQALPYINENGQLCVSAFVFETVSADMVYHFIDIEKKSDEGYFFCEKQTHGSEEGATGETDTDSALSEEPLPEETLGKEPLPEESTAAVSASSAYERDKKIYNDYFRNTGYKDMQSVYEDSSASDIKVLSCMVDLNADSVHELLILVRNTKYMGVRGYDESYGFYTIKNGSHVLLVYAWSGGGSIGGGRLEIVYDTMDPGFAVVKSEYVRDGAFANCCTTEIYRQKTGFSRCSDTFFAEHITIPESIYEDRIESIKSETDLYFITDDGLFFKYFKRNGKYIHMEEHDNYVNIALDKRNTGIYEMKETSYSSPVK